MKIRLVLERSNFNEGNSPNFDWQKDYIIMREEVFSLDVRKLTKDEMKEVESDFYEKVMFLYPRNGIERIVNEDEQYINLLLLDYPLNEQWGQDQHLLEVIEYLTKEYEHLQDKKLTTEYQVKDIEINNIIEIDSLGGVGNSEKEILYDLLIKEGYKFDVIYEETSVYNAGATGGGIKLILTFLGHAADIIAIKEFFKKYFPYGEERISSYNIETIKQEISKNITYMRIN